MTLDELFAHKKFKRTVAERIARLNPDGVQPGSILRGYHRRTSADWMYVGYLVPQREYVKRWGAKGNANVVFKRGRAKYVTRQAYERGPF